MLVAWEARRMANTTETCQRPVFKTSEVGEVRHEGRNERRGLGVIGARKISDGNH